jgi:hypothetical protein
LTQEASTTDGVASQPIQLGALCLSPSARFAFGLSLLFLYLLASLGTPVCFDDCRGYIPLMGMNWLDYFPALMASFRPWFILMFFSLFGPYSIESATRIVLAQSFIAFFAWLSFAYAASLMLRVPPIRRFGFIVMALLMFGQGYYHFNQYLLSDSLGLSSVLLQWAQILLFPAFVAWARRTGKSRLLIFFYLISLALVSAIEMATRDANIMMALAGWAYLLWRSLTGVFHDDRQVRILLYKVSVAVIAIAIGQMAFTGKRRHENAQNIMAGAVIPNDEMRAYFIQRGMSACPQILSAKPAPLPLGNIDYHEVDHIRGLVAQASADPACYSFLMRIDSLYLGFLLTHPEYVVSNTWRYWRMIFDFRLVRDRKSTAIKDIHPGDMVPFVFGESLDLSPADYFPPQVGVALFMSCFLLPWLRRDGSSWLPLFLALLGAGNALIGFFADVWSPGEMARHAAIGSVMLRVGLTLCALMLLDAAAQRMSFPRGRRKLPAAGAAHPQAAVSPCQSM